MNKTALEINFYVNDMTTKQNSHDNCFLKFVDYFIATIRKKFNTVVLVYMTYSEELLRTEITIRFSIDENRLDELRAELNKHKLYAGAIKLIESGTKHDN